LIKITCIDGPFTGKVRYFLGIRAVKSFKPYKELGETIDPSGLFRSFLSHNWRWEVDYSKATDEEILKWFPAEMIARILRALEKGLPVKFLGQEYRMKEGDSLQETGQTIEDAIVASGMMVTIGSDDENGLAIEAIGHYH